MPFPPGGATDVLGRVLATHLQALWGQTVISDYRPGAAGLIGTRQVIGSPADGHTLLMASTGAILALAGGQAGAFDVTRELSPVSLIAAPPYIVVANPAVPARNTAELIAHAKANPGKLTFGSSGAGSASHLSGALFGQMAGVELLHVPYRGTGPAVTDLLGGRIDLMFSPALVVTPHIAAGTLRVMGVTGAARSALFPDFPTIAETGLAGLPVARLVRPVRAGGHAARHRRQGERRRRPRAGVAGCEAAARRAGRRARAEHAGSVHGVRERRCREVARVGWEGGDQVEPLTPVIVRLSGQSLARASQRKRL